MNFLKTSVFPERVRHALLIRKWTSPRLVFASLVQDSYIDEMSKVVFERVTSDLSVIFMENIAANLSSFNVYGGSVLVLDLNCN
jgi:hypothetical protein